MITPDGPLSGIASEDDYTPEMIRQLEERADRNIARDNERKAKERDSAPGCWGEDAPFYSGGA